MFTPTQLEVIRVFGRKELTEGCIVKDLYRDNQNIGKYICDWKYFYEGNILFIPDNEMTDGWEVENLFEILGHIPHLEDVFRVAKEKRIAISLKYFYTSCNYSISFEDIDKGGTRIATIGINPTLPLLEQSESTLLELLKLFK